MNFMLSLGIMEPLYRGFGWLLSYLYVWLQNYGLVIILFNLAIRIPMLPLNLQTQRGFARQIFLRDDINEIKRFYADDPQKAQEEQMILFSRHGVSMFGGCLPQLVQFIVILGFWRPIRSPLQYIAHVNPDNITSILELLVNKSAMASNTLKFIRHQDVAVLSALRNNKSELAACVNKGLIRLDQVLDLKFLGMDLGRVPKDIFTSDTPADFISVIILVIVMIVTMVLSMRIARINQPNFSKSKAEQERDKKNPAKGAQLESNQGAGMLKGMQIFMPLMMLYTAFVTPAAMALAWLAGNLVAILQAGLSYQFYTKPAREVYQARKNEKQIPRRRKA